MFGIGSDSGSREPAHIEVEDLEYWTQTLHVDEATLRGALQAVGFTPDDVRDYLRERQTQTRAL